MSTLQILYGAVALALVLGGAVGGWILRRIVTGWWAERRATTQAHDDQAIAVTRPADVELTATERAEWPHLRISMALPAITDADRNTDRRGGASPRRRAP